MPIAKKKSTSASRSRKKAAAPAKTKKKSGGVTKAAKKTAPPRKKAKSTVAKAPKKTAATDRGTVVTLSTHDFTGFTPYKMKKGEEYMNEAQIEHFRRILIDWKLELMHEVDRTMHHMQDDAANFPDPNDRATQESDFTLELRTRDRERKLIKKIDEALGKLEDGDYGYCDICGVEIGIRRLEARPTATQCIDCKTLDEIREKQLGG